MAHRPSAIESLESRQLLSFAQLDPTYGTGGVATPAKSGGTSADTYPLSDGGSIVRVSNTDFRRLDAHGHLVKLFGGGDGVLTPIRAASLVAVDGQSGQIALLFKSGGSPTLAFYSADGTFERYSSPGVGNALNGATQLVFDFAGRVLVGNEARVSRFIAASGVLDPTFGSDGSLELATDPLPAGHPSFIDVGDDDQQSTLTLVGLLVRDGGALTIVRSYSTNEPLNSFEAGSYLEVNSLDADGHASTGDSISTILTGFEHNNSRGGVDAERLDILGVAAAPDNSVTLLARQSQSSTTPATGSAAASVAYYTELKLFRVSDRLAAERSLDNVFQFPHGSGFSYGNPQLAVDRSRGMAYVVANNRIAAFDTGTLRPFKSFNGVGSQSAQQLTAKSAISSFTVGNNGRLLLSDSNRIRALTGGSFNSFDAPAGVATLMADGTLAVIGTAKHDVVTFTAGKKHQISVSINGHVQLFDRNAVTGIVVQTGDGDDTIDGSKLNDIAAGLYILPGHGNDRIIGSEGADTIDGGAGGRDWITAGSGDDLAFGVADDDIVGGAEHGDTLFAKLERQLF